MTGTDRIIHRPVLLQEIRAFLREDFRMLVDGTTGEGGHSAMMLQHYRHPVCLLCLDWDRDMLQRAKHRLLPHSNAHRVTYVHGNFKDLAAILQQQQQQADFILLDLGISTRHYVASDRGFSFSDDAPLDLRINREQGKPLSAILPGLTQAHLADIIHHLSDERLARPIARAIYAHRHELTTARQLKTLIERTVGRRYHDHIHPATRTFMALRIFINQELDNLTAFLETVP